MHQASQTSAAETARHRLLGCGERLRQPRRTLRELANASRRLGKPANAFPSSDACHPEGGTHALRSLRSQARFAQGGATEGSASSCSYARSKRVLRKLRMALTWQRKKAVSPQRGR